MGLAHKTGLIRPSGQVQRAGGRGCVGQQLAGLEHLEPGGAQADRLHRVARLQQHHVGLAAHCQPIALQAQGAGRVDGDGIKALAHGGLAGHLAHVQAHVRDFEHVTTAQAVPGVHHAVVAKGDVDAGRQQLRYARHAAAFGVAVVPALQRDVDQRVGYHVQLRLGHQRDQL